LGGDTWNLMRHRSAHNRGASIYELCVAQHGLKLMISGLYLPSVGITGVCQHTQHCTVFLTCAKFSDVWKCVWEECLCCDMWLRVVVSSSQRKNVTNYTVSSSICQVFLTVASRFSLNVLSFSLQSLRRHRICCTCGSFPSPSLDWFYYHFILFGKGKGCREWVMRSLWELDISTPVLRDVYRLSFAWPQPEKRVRRQNAAQLLFLSCLCSEK
jgi:hypothetical protein